MSSVDRLLIGQILLERKQITSEQISHGRAMQDAEVAAGSARRTLGEILVEQNLVTAADRDAALIEQRKRIVEYTIGPYRIVDKLGQGGMGAVYRARIPETNIEVALKLLPRKLAADPNYLARFRREALIGISMNHPAIVRTVDFGEYKGTYYLAMEIVEGGTLDERLVRHGKMEERDAFAMAADLLDALHHAHQRGLVHRDIKPSNIIFDRAGKPKLSDFGLAKDSSPDPSFMTAGYTVGTPHYMAPEQARGQADIDIRADLYSLGATLYHAVAGTTPYQGSSTQLLTTRTDFHPVPSPRQFNKALSAGCTAIIGKLMARNRDRRYATPLEARADIQRLLDGEIPLALPLANGDNSGFVRVVSAPTPTSSSSRRRRRWRWSRGQVIVLLAGAALVGIALGVLTTLLLTR